MTTKTPVGYLYRDETYCTTPDCVMPEVVATLGTTDDECASVEQHLNQLADLCGFDRSCPASFSQRDFPHTITSGQLDEPVRCDTCQEEIR